MERDAVCRGQYHGWSKETIGSHIIRRCNIHHCEQTGIVGRMGCVFSIIEDNHIHHINNMMQLGGAEIAGIKFHAAIDVIFRRNHIHHSTMGIWCDWQAQGTRITQNLMHDNETPADTPKAPGAMMSEDIFIEVGHGPTLIDNNILMSKAAVRIATQGVACVHNLILGAFTSVGGGTDMNVNGVNQPRYTPYHIPHRTEVSGFMTILHGDNRIYNNIFIQKNPVVEVEAKEDMGFMMVDQEHEIYVKLLEKDGKYGIDTNVYEFLDGFKAGIINSDILGEAFEPEERFENPDGTDIVFDSDYFGDHRGVWAIPGPFAMTDAVQKKIW